VVISKIRVELWTREQVKAALRKTYGIEREFLFDVLMNAQGEMWENRVPTNRLRYTVFRYIKLPWFTRW
jgi:hypothetical protein